MNEKIINLHFAIIKKNGKEIMSLVKKNSFRDLLTDCEIGLSTVYWTKAVFLKIYSHH